MNINNYEAVVELSKKLLAAEKDVVKKSDKIGAMNFRDHSIKSRAAASDRLTSACFARDCAKDDLHKLLVDSGLSAPKAITEYDTRLLCHSHGFGHSAKFKYTPPLPKCYAQDATQ